MNRHRPGTRQGSRNPRPPEPHVLLLAAGLGLLISGCGNRGPLYLPEPAAAPVQSPASMPGDSPPGTARSDSPTRADRDDNGDEDGRDDDTDDIGDSGQLPPGP